MGNIATAFAAAFKLADNTDPADCQALGATIETAVGAPRTHNKNAYAAPTSMPSGGVLRSIGADGENAGDVLDAFGGVPTGWLRRANGTGASPAAVASGDIVGRWNFTGYYVTGGPAYATAPASLRCVATQNWSSTAQGAKLVWSATANGSATSSDYWTLDHNGSFTGTGAFGYATGAGGTVTQSASKATGVTLSKLSGDITLNNAALAPATIVSFVLTNSLIGATDVLILNHVSGGTLGAYALNARCAAGSATIDVRNA
ncbi:MAG: hypothetical protein FJX06_18225, partial [Alphaproteobacteria bacterium]|nr:hypothetical protein [Alphaproteobacteria bacterium]